ncbi:MAG: NAD-dependent protein deacylase [Clostridia bacterium]|nr:NAD-dependent protein deacylase [Clostridia bacterium]
MFSDDLATLQQWIDEAQRIVFFGGAGVSTESGIPDFRSTDGLYHQQFDYPPETILSRSFFDTHPEEFFRFYRDKMVCTTARPNPAHRKLAELEQAGKLTAVITQNIDNLHQMAGSRNVLELHGSVWKNRCMRCKKPFDAEVVLQGNGVPRCDCGGIVKPEVVLYEESLDEEVIEASIRALMEADLLLVGGTSLVVWPAAGLIRYYKGNRLVLLNKGETPYDSEADLIFRTPIGETLSQILVR